uniref:Glycosyl transferase n=1 Tax=Cyanothece sp. (strain PCC 7425 / ATCC 29141) TaxID=395961 RepID=B8HT87_CYAP4
MNPSIIGMMSSYPGLNQSDWLWQQTPHSFGHWGKIQMLANAPQPDFLLLYQYDFVRNAQPPQHSWRSQIKHWLKPGPAQLEKPPDFRGVPLKKIIYLIREPPLDKILGITQQNYQIAQHYCGYISGPDDFAPVPDYMPAIWYHSNSFRELVEMPVPDKPGTCSWITSGIDRSVNHLRRLAFLHLLREQGLKIDLYGRGLPNWAQGRGTVNNKWHAMAPYRYNLAIENYAENSWYVSEKLWDALLAWCLPIYYGGPAADQLLPPGSFLRLPSLDEKGLEFIRDITATPDAWYQSQPAIAEARQIILHNLNLLNWLSEFVERFSL